MPSASGLPGQETGCGAGAVEAGAGVAGAGVAAGAAAGPAATVVPVGAASVLSGAAEAEVTSAVATGATLATVDTGSAGGTGLGAAAGLSAGALAATELGGERGFILVSATAARTENTTMAQAIMRRMSNLRVTHPVRIVRETRLLRHQLQGLWLRFGVCVAFSPHMLTEMVYHITKMFHWTAVL